MLIVHAQVQHAKPGGKGKGVGGGGSLYNQYTEMVHLLPHSYLPSHLGHKFMICKPAPVWNLISTFQTKNVII